MEKTEHDLVLVIMPVSLQQWCFALPALKALVASSQENTTCVMVIDELMPYLGEIGVRTIRVGKKVSDSAVRKALQSLEFQPKLVLNVSDVTLKHASLSQLTLFQFPECLSDGGVGEGFQAHRDQRRATHIVERYLSAIRVFGIETNRKEFFPEQTVSSPKGEILVSTYSEYGKSYYNGLEDAFSGVIDRFVPCAAIRTSYDEDLIKTGEWSSNEIITKRIDQLEWQAKRLLLEGVDLVIAPESDLLHLAANEGIPTVALFGPGHLVETRPLGGFHTILSAQAECQPCLMPKCQLDQRCTRNIQPNQLRAEVIKALQMRCK